MGQFVHPAFAHEVVGSGREAAVGALTQRRARLVELLLLPGDVIGRLQAAGPRVVVVEVPLGDDAVGRGLATHLDESAGTEVSPSHLFFASPVPLHGPADRFGDASGLQAGVALVLAAITAAGVGDDY